MEDKADPRTARDQRAIRMRTQERTVAIAAALVLLSATAVTGLRVADRPGLYDEDAAVAAFRSAEGRTAPGAGGAEPQPNTSQSEAASGGIAPAAPVRKPGPIDRNPVAPENPAEPPPLPAPAKAAPVQDPTATAQAHAPHDRAPAGVYRYRTQGAEQVDALGGSQHQYPAATSITYTARGCDSQERWQPTRERISTATRCSTRRGLELRVLLQEREFFGQRVVQELTCAPGVLLRPHDPQEGQEWTGACMNEDTTASITGRVVAKEVLAVGGADIRATRIMLRTTLSGATRGRSHREVWLSDDGLTLKAIGSTDTQTDTATGTVRYQEQYQLELASLTPKT